MNEVIKEAVTLEEVQNAPMVEGEEGTSEVVEESVKKDEVIEKPPVPYDRFDELNKELKETRQEIQDLRSKGKEEGLSEDEKKELAAKTYIEKTAREAYEKMVVDNATQEAARETEIATEIKFYQSIDKDFNEKVAEEIGDKYGTEKNPISVDVAYNIFKENKQLKSQIVSPKPKVPNPIRSTDAVEIRESDADKGKGFWQIIEEAKQTLRGK